MRTKLLSLAIFVLSIALSGCATRFRASGPRNGGVSAEAGVAAPAAPIVIHEPSHLPPSPPTPPPPEAF
jgi:hypothetical protein